MKRFTSRNDDFVCGHCHHKVLPADKGILRNHCPRCLYSKHVDIFPGDRAEPCNGLMKPIEVRIGGKDGYILIHQCLKCGQVTKNRTATKSTIDSDSMEQIIKLSAKGDH